jgi:predicted permease
MLPNWKQIVRQHLAPLRLPPEREIEIAEELALHLEAVYDAALAASASEAEAQAQALRVLADGCLLECELSRVERPVLTRHFVFTRTVEWLEQKGGTRMESLWQDLRYGVRTLQKSWGLTLLIVLTLALGIGANTAIFSVVNAVLLNPLPYREPEHLVMLWEHNAERGKQRDNPSPGDFLDLRTQTQVFDSVTAWYETAFTLQGEQDAEQVTAAKVSVEFFQVLRAQAARGRVFLPHETAGVATGPGAQNSNGDRLVVISDSLWRRRFGADPALLGRQITINREPWQVLGVMPAGFALPSTEVDLWLPWDLARSYGPHRFPAGPPRDSRFLRVLARLKAGVTYEQAQSHLNVFYAGLAERYPKTNRGWGAGLTTLREEVVGKTQLSLLVLFGAVALVLLIACANVAGLLLARAAARQREIAVRTALGAARARLLRQLLTESLLLSLLGGVCGLGLTLAGLDLLVALAPADVPRLSEVAVDGRVLAFTFSVSVLTGLLFGLVPAWKGTQTDLTVALKEGGARGVTSGVAQQRWRNALVVVEIALAVVLLAGAGLLVRSFQQLRAVDPGFDARNLLTMHITLDGTVYGGGAAQYYQQLIERLEALPSVISAAAVTTLPMNNVGVDFDRPYWREGAPEPSGNADKVDVRMATPGYFKTLGITLLRGRNFSAEDRPDTPAVLIVNESMANQVWPNEDPIGKRLMLDYNRGKYAYEVIGVTRGIRYYGLKSTPQPEVFIPHAQNAYLPMNVVVRTALPPTQMINAVKAEVRALDPTQPAHNVVTMEQLSARSLAPERFSMGLLGVLAALALVLAATGIYGLMSYLVSQRVHEIGVRLALGAQTNDVLKLVLGQGMRLALVGVAVGLLTALTVTRWFASLLFGVSATDPLTFAVIISVLLLVALFACWIPARRAARVDPLVALRCE